MRLIRLAITLVCLSLPLAPAAPAAPLAKRVDHAMLDEMARQELVGLAVGVIQDGQIKYLKGYGMADREQRVPVTRQTMFRWASISKSITAVAAMQLWERGDLDLEREPRRVLRRLHAQRREEVGGPREPLAVRRRRVHATDSRTHQQLPRVQPCSHAD